MGRHRQLKCRKGHDLIGDNVVWNSDTTRECRLCKYARTAKTARDKRAEKRRIRES